MTSHKFMNHALTSFWYRPSRGGGLAYNNRFVADNSEMCTASCARQPESLRS
jgi:hypothetical protein